MTRVNEARTDFVRRMNTDGSYDSICRYCSRSVAHEPDALKLDESEERHSCPKKRAARRGRSRDR